VNPFVRDVAWQGANLSLGQRNIVSANFAPRNLQKLDISALPELGPEALGLIQFLPGPFAGNWRPLGSLVSTDEGAYIDYIDPLPHLNVRGQTLPEYIAIDHADVEVDNFRLKHIILKESRITYAGGKLILDTVYFVNCTFYVSQTPRGASLIAALLENTGSVSLRSLDK
jgi:hypothetical protein